MPSGASAGAWNQPEGQGQVIVTGRYYQTEKFIDNNGNTHGQPKYAKFEFEPYVEYGVTDWLTIGSSARADYVRQYMGSNDHNYGIGDAELFARMPVWKTGSMVVSVQPLIKLPSAWELYNSPAIGRNGWDAEMKLAAGYGFSLFGNNDYVDASIAYRSRFGAGDQLRYELAAGIYPWQSLGFIGRFSHIEPIGSEASSLGIISENQDYSLSTAELSALYALSATSSVQLGGYRNIDGENTGGGGGFMLGWWFNF